jgi:YD repeat-containing protein
MISIKAGVLYLFLAMLLSACSKEYTPDPVTTPPPANGKKLSKIQYDDGSYEAIEYHTNGTVKKITNHIAFSNNTSEHVVYTFVYSGSNVSEIQGDDGSVIKYSYNGNQLVKAEVFVNGGTLVAWYAYSYTNGKLIKTEGYTRKPGSGLSTTPTLKYEKEYYSNGNLKKMTLFYQDPATGTLDKTNVFVLSQYDTNPNTTALFENNPYLPLESLIPNNPLAEEHYDESGNLIETVTHTYTYDASGNPLTRKTVTKSTGLPESVENAMFSY